jgi:hypothetical protein
VQGAAQFKHGAMLQGGTRLSQDRNGRFAWRIGGKILPIALNVILGQLALALALVPECLRGHIRAFWHAKHAQHRKTQRKFGHISMAR